MANRTPHRNDSRLLLFIDWVQKYKEFFVPNEEPAFAFPGAFPVLLYKITIIYLFETGVKHNLC